MRGDQWRTQHAPSMTPDVLVSLDQVGRVPFVERELGDVVVQASGANEHLGPAVVQRACAQQQDAAVDEEVRPHEGVIQCVVQLEHARVVRRREVIPHEVVGVGAREEVQFVESAQVTDEADDVVERLSVRRGGRAEPGQSHATAEPLCSLRESCTCCASHNGSSARSAPEDSGNQPRAHRDIKAGPWLID